MVRLTLAATAAALAVLTAIEPDWIEDLFGITTNRKDGGSVEWLIVGFFAFIALTWGNATRAGWQRAKARREEVTNTALFPTRPTRAVGRVPRLGTLQADPNGGESRDVVTETGTRLAHNIRLARVAAELSQRQLGDLINVSRTRIADYEGARHTPSHEHLEAIADATGKTVAWLFDQHPELDA